MRGRLSKKWGDAQRLADAQMKRRERSGVMVNLICKLWEQMPALWKERNESKHGRTPEEIQQWLRKTVNSLVKAACETRETAVSLFNQRLFRVNLEDRLSMSPAENTRWLEIIHTATAHEKLREEAVIAATRRIIDIHPIIERPPKERRERAEGGAGA